VTRTRDPKQNPKRNDTLLASRRLYGSVDVDLLFTCVYKVLNKAEIIKQDAVQQCKDEVNIQVRE